MRRSGKKKEVKTSKEAKKRQGRTRNKEVKQGKDNHRSEKRHDVSGNDDRSIDHVGITMLHCSAHSSCLTSLKLTSYPCHVAILDMMQIAHDTNFRLGVCHQQHCKSVTGVCFD